MTPPLPDVAARTRLPPLIVAVPVATNDGTVRVPDIVSPALETKSDACFPSTMSAFRFDTVVVELTINGADPVPTVEVIGLLNDFVPVTVCPEARSTKFWVFDPVPPC